MNNNKTTEFRSGAGMSGHHSAVMGKDEWLTPPEITGKLGTFDLDPCSPIIRPWPTAQQHYTIQDNGLNNPWCGRVWCNPPYGLVAAKWLERCANHGNAIALIFARTETRMFFDHVWNRAHALLFIEGRLCFHHVDGTRAKSNGGAPSVLVAYGENNSQILNTCGIPGKYIKLSPLQSGDLTMSNCTGCRALEINNGRCLLGHKVGRKIIDGYKVTHPLESCSKPKTDAQLAQALEVGK